MCQEEKSLSSHSKEQLLKKTIKNHQRKEKGGEKYDNFIFFKLLILNFINKHFPVILKLFNRPHLRI